MPEIETQTDDYTDNMGNQISTVQKLSRSLSLASSSSSPLKYTGGHQPFTVLVEGNIGCGKSTFMDYFAAKYSQSMCLIPEPVAKWQNVGGFNLLDFLYKEPNKWAMPFQTYVTVTMLDSHTRATSKPVKMMERSLFSARNCFINYMKQNGNLHEGMHSVLSEWFDFIDKSIDIRADLIVYLRSTPDIVYKRMVSRGRAEENYVPLSYLEDLHTLHEKWLIEKTITPNNVPILILDANLSKNHMVYEYERCYDKIAELRCYEPSLAQKFFEMKPLCAFEDQAPPSLPQQQSEQQNDNE